MDRREAIKRTALLMGGIVSTPAIMGVLKGCKAEPGVDFKPQFFSEGQAQLISQVAEIIIPKTETAGARDAGVPAFIDQILKEVYSEAQQNEFITGLEDFDEEARRQYGDAFNDLDEGQQKEYVFQVHKAAIEQRDYAQPRPFILNMKELTMLGFFTSKPGATEVLQYDPVPGVYRGCIDLSEAGNGKTWAS